LEKFKIENIEETKSNVDQELPSSITSQSESTSINLHKQQNENVTSYPKKNNNNNNDLFLTASPITSSAQSTSTINFNIFNENIVLYPNEEVHQLNNIDLNEITTTISMDNQTDLVVNNLPEPPSKALNDINNKTSVRIKLKSTSDDYDLITVSPPKLDAIENQLTSINNNQTQAKPNTPNRMHLIQQELVLEDETMMIDDFALISSKANKKKLTNIKSSVSTLMTTAKMPSTNSAPTTTSTTSPSRNRLLHADQLRAGLTLANSKSNIK
jgi:hypothetical protein